MSQYKKPINDDITKVTNFLDNNVTIKSKQQFKKLSSWVRRLYIRLILEDLYDEVNEPNFIFRLHDASYNLHYPEGYMAGVVINKLYRYHRDKLDQEVLKVYEHDYGAFSDRVKFYSEWEAALEDYDNKYLNNETTN